MKTPKVSPEIEFVERNFRHIELKIFTNFKIIMSRRSGPSLLFSMRFLLALIIFAGVGMQYMQKIDMGIAIVCMVNETAVKNMEPNNTHPVANLTGCLFHPESKNTTVKFLFII